MSQTLKLPMMMFGKFRSTRAKRDKEGNTIIKRRDAKGRPVYETEKCWVTHTEGVDKGVYPSVNHIYTRIAKGRQKLTAPAEQLKERWEAMAMMWMQDTGWQKTEKEKVVVELTAYFPDDKIKRDINNVFKLMMDAFNDIIYDDDHYALPRVMDFHTVKDGEQPYFELRIFKKSDEDAIMMERMANNE